LAVINQRHLRHRRREHLERLERLEHLEPLEHLRQHRRRVPLEKLERPERPERLEHPERLRQHQKKSRRGISGYILAKRIYPKSMEEEVDYEIKFIELKLKPGLQMMIFSSHSKSVSKRTRALFNLVEKPT
jgi:hypothetical protein